MEHLDEKVELDGEPFLVALGQAMRKEMAVRAGQEFAQLVQDVKDLHKKGRMTVTIELDPDKRDPDVVIVTCDTSVKPPKPTPTGQMMWPVDGGRLSRKNPAQVELPGLSAVDGGRTDDRKEQAQ